MSGEYQGGQGRRLTPEERKIRIKKLKRKRRFRLAIVVSAFFLLLALIISPIVIFAAFRVKTFTVEGNSPYNNEQIIAASGIEQGKSLIFADLDEAAAAIEKTLPYAVSVKLTKKLPSEIVIRLQEASGEFAVEMGSDTYALADSTMKTLEIVGSVPSGVIVIRGATPVKSQLGEEMTFSGADAQTDATLNLLKKIAGAVSSNKMEDINLINIQDRSGIYIIYQGRIVMRIGDSTDIESKLSLGQRVIKEEDTIDPDQSGVINLTVAKKAYFNPAAFDDVEELVEYRKENPEPENFEKPDEPEDENETDEE